jgi:Protein of unknown function (DUF1759)
MSTSTAAAKLKAHIGSYDEGIRRHAGSVATYVDRDAYYLERKLDALTSYIEKRFIKVDALREVLVDEAAEIQKLNDDDFNIMELYDTAAATLQRMIDTLKPKREEEGDPPPPPPNRPRIPEMPLPYFNGNLNDWIAYKTNFVSLIKGNQAIDNTAKLYYLRQSLRGPASSINRRLTHLMHYGTPCANDLKTEGSLSTATSRN